jgi:ActR/RegA family two-component response regulator
VSERSDTFNYGLIHARSIRPVPPLCAQQLRFKTRPDTKKRHIHCNLLKPQIRLGEFRCKPAPEEGYVEKKSVLIVDDDDSIRASLVSLLRSDVVETQTASTMEEAETLLKTDRFDLAIVDLRLGGSGGAEGLELISTIKARTPETQVALFTGYGSPEIEREARERGAADYWEKTIKIATLLERLGTLGVNTGHATMKQS